MAPAKLQLHARAPYKKTAPESHKETRRKKRERWNDDGRAVSDFRALTSAGKRRRVASEINRITRKRGKRTRPIIKSERWTLLQETE